MEVKLPSSHVEIQVPESNVIVLFVGADATLAVQMGLNSQDAALINKEDLGRTSS